MTVRPSLHLHAPFPISLHSLSRLYSGELQKSARVLNVEKVEERTGISVSVDGSTLSSVGGLGIEGVDVLWILRETFASDGKPLLPSSCPVPSHPIRYWTIWDSSVVICQPLASNPALFNLSTH